MLCCEMATHATVTLNKNERRTKKMGVKKKEKEKTFQREWAFRSHFSLLRLLADVFTFLFHSISPSVFEWARIFVESFAKLFAQQVVLIMYLVFIWCCLFLCRESWSVDYLSLLLLKNIVFSSVWVLNAKENDILFAQHSLYILYILYACVHTQRKCCNLFFTEYVMFHRVVDVVVE